LKYYIRGNFWKGGFCLLMLLLVGQLKAQLIDSSLITTDKKPLLAPSQKKKGSFLGGRLSTSGGPDLEGAKEKADKFKSETLPELGLKVKKAKEEAKKYIKKNEYEGLKMEKRIAVFGNGSRQTTEEFYVLNDQAEISMYTRELRWYDPDMQRSTNNPVKDWENITILHGPYKKYLADELVEEGYYYLGTKHGRWEAYGKDIDGDIALLDKQYYDKGNPAESQISYYDEANTKIKEIIPYIYGKKTGNYYSYYASGHLQAEGKYDDGDQVGKWIEYYEFGQSSKRKKETQYKRDKYDQATQTFVIREYDNTGKLVFENTEALKHFEAEKN
jgi:antitoxin component YwqK of YwqJK toxin-antitoxin module